VSINSREYQKFTGRKDYNNASKLIKKDLDNLYRLSIKFEKIPHTGKRKAGEFKPSLDTRILVAKSEKKRGIFNVVLMPEFVAHLVDAKQMMQLPVYYWKATPVASELLFFFEV
jgi:hypothetical protein